MARRSEVGAVYAAALLQQGLALVTFPAASAILTSPQHYGLSSGEYGLLFVPQTLMAIGTSLFGRELAHRWSEKRVFLVGLAADLTSIFAGFRSCAARRSGHRGRQPGRTSRSCYDEKSSCSIRTMQPWAGAAWGHQFVPRVGMEA